jgi:protein dithiol oxidoreductase (disulfide-forming)
MRWLAVLVASVGLAACGSDGDSSKSPDSQAAASSGANQSKTESQSSSSDAANESAEPNDAGEAQPAKVAPVSETGDEVSDNDSSSSLESLKLAALPVTKAVPGFKEGVNYKRLVPVQTTGAAVGMVHVAEFFTYGCKPCFEVDAKINAWQAKHKPAYVVFERIPAVADGVQKFHARAYYFEQQLAALDRLHPLLFSEIQDGAAIDNNAALAKFFVAQDIERKAVETILKSNDVDAQLARASDLQRRYRVDSLPYFVVNGKFVTTLAMAGDEERLFALINQLAIREHEF